MDPSHEIRILVDIVASLVEIYDEVTGLTIIEFAFMKRLMFGNLSPRIWCKTNS